MAHAGKGTNTLQLDVGITDFWQAIRSAPSVALLLDYDGTLAPFHVDRLKAVPLDGVVQALEELASQTDTHTALVSGRPVNEILSLMPDLGITIIGTHGFEVRHPDAGIETIPVTEKQAQLLDRADADARRIVGANRTERKAATVAAHIRGLGRLDARQVQRELSDRWMSYADFSAVEVRQFNGGLEMRALGRHKGIAVAEYLDTCPQGTLAVYIGDDDTDEDAFRAVTDAAGYGIRVGDHLDSTAAQGSLETCDEVLLFLRQWIENRRQQ